MATDTGAFLERSCGVRSVAPESSRVGGPRDGGGGTGKRMAGQVVNEQGPGSEHGPQVELGALSRAIPRGGLDRSVQRQRVEALLAAAASLRDDTTELGARARPTFVETTGLSPEGVDQALRHHLEALATPELFETEGARAARTDAAPTAHVVLSANVFVGALRALVLASLVAQRVVVLPSRREPATVALLLDAGGDTLPWISLGDSLSPAPRDEVHVYGRDETIKAIAAELPDNVKMWGHGAGVGIVATADGATVDADALADDVVVFDQRGCLSPRVVLVRTGGEALAKRLSAALERKRTEIPLGRVATTERAVAAAYEATLAATGETFGSFGALVGFVASPRALLFPSVPRLVHVVESDDPVGLLAPFASFVTSVAGDDAAVLESTPGARHCAIGQQQRPPLDGPVDLRTPRAVPVELLRQMTR
jgi:hypothetical protein